MGTPQDGGEQLSPKMRRDLKRLHRQMAADEAAGGVDPPTPIENLRTGQLTHFGPRRAYDGSYVTELLAAKGVLHSDIEGLRFIAEALGPEFAHMKIGELDKLSILFHEQMTKEELTALYDAGEGASATKVNGVLSIKPGKPRLHIVPRADEIADAIADVTKTTVKAAKLGVTLRSVE
jgi:hypothetical protein